jgi:hypothetical protein
MGLELQIQLGIRTGMYQHIVYKIIAAPNKNNPITPISFKESAAPLKGVDVGEDVFPGFTRIVVVVDSGELSLAVVEAEAVEEGPAN